MDPKGGSKGTGGDNRTGFWRQGSVCVFRWNLPLIPRFTYHPRSEATLVFPFHIYSLKKIRIRKYRGAYKPLLRFAPFSAFHNTPHSKGLVNLCALCPPSRISTALFPAAEGSCLSTDNPLGPLSPKSLQRRNGSKKARIYGPKTVATVCATVAQGAHNTQRSIFRCCRPIRDSLPPAFPALVPAR